MRLGFWHVLVKSYQYYSYTIDLNCTISTYESRCVSQAKCVGKLPESRHYTNLSVTGINIHLQQRKDGWFESIMYIQRDSIFIKKERSININHLLKFPGEWHPFSSYKLSALGSLRGHIRTQNRYTAIVWWYNNDSIRDIYALRLPFPDGFQTVIVLNGCFSG